MGTFGSSGSASQQPPGEILPWWFCGDRPEPEPPLWTLRHSGSPKISSSSRTTSAEVTGPQNPTAMAGSGKLLWCRARWDLPTFPGQRRAEVNGFMPGGSWPPALPGSPHRGPGDAVVALTAQRSGGCCPHGPSDGGSSLRGLPGTTGSGGGEMRKMKHREEEQGCSSPKPARPTSLRVSAAAQLSLLPHRQRRPCQQHRERLRVAANTCFAQFSPQTIPSPILLCNSRSAGTGAGPAATSLSPLICSGSGHMLHKATPAFRREQRGFFPAAGPAETRARPILLCKLARGFASAGPAGDLYGWG